MVICRDVSLSIVSVATCIKHFVEVRGESNSLRDFFEPFRDGVDWLIEQLDGLVLSIVV